MMTIILILLTLMFAPVMIPFWILYGIYCLIGFSGLFTLFIILLLLAGLGDAASSTGVKK